MRVQPCVCLLVGVAAIAASAGSVAARPTVAIAGIEIAGDSVGVDVEAAGIARELTWGLRRAAGRAESPLQLVDPMVRADDVEALVWGKLLRDGDGWVATIHLSAVGSDGDTVSFRAVIGHDRTSSIELGRWGRQIYEALLDQIDLEDKDDEPGPGTPVAPPEPTGPVDVFAVRDPTLGRHTVVPDDDEPDAGPEPSLDPVVVEPGPQFHRDRRVAAERPKAGARRLFWISAAVAAGGALFWGYAAFQVADAEDQIARLAGCTGCDRAIAAANSQGNRWEGISWLAGTATVAGAAAALLFGYQGYVVGKKPSPSELVGGRAVRPHRAVTVTPVLGPDRVGAGVSVAF